MIRPSVVFAFAVFTTYFCTAVNCYTYRIAYPLWRFVGPAQFGALHREYLQRLGPVITLPHVAMFLATGLLLWRRPESFPISSAIWVFGLATTVIIISAGVAGPIHDRFQRNGVIDEPGMRVLMAVSLVRVGLMLGACGILGGRMAAGR